MGYRLIFCTSWFRPQQGRDMGVDLLDRLNRGEFRLAGVIGPDEEGLAAQARQRGIPYLPLLPEFRWTSAKLKRELEADSSLRSRMDRWLEVVREFDADLGFLYFATWIPGSLLQIPRRGWVNFHPAPLPELRGFLPEDFAVLWGWTSMAGTLHVATEEIDEGDIIAWSRPARIGRWDTPDSVMQKVGESVRSLIRPALKRYLNNRAQLIHQKTVPGFMADYHAFYPHSFLNWSEDSHNLLHRKFQTFRGQNHRVELKASVGGALWTVTSMELHSLRARGEPGDILGTHHGHVVVRTREGVALLTGVPFVRDEGLPGHLDRQVQDVLPPGRRRARFRKSELAGFVAESSVREVSQSHRQG